MAAVLLPTLARAREAARQVDYQDGLELWGVYGMRFGESEDMFAPGGMAYGTENTPNLSGVIPGGVNTTWLLNAAALYHE